MAALERGHEPPAAVVIDVAPPAAPYYRGWWRLHAARIHAVSMAGGVPAGLPWTEVEGYARAHGARTRQDVDEWDDIMSTMEVVYFQHVANQGK